MPLIHIADGWWLHARSTTRVSSAKAVKICCVAAGHDVGGKASGPCLGVVVSPLCGEHCCRQVLRRKYGKEADLWSAGVILYILLSGVPPFWGETEQQIFDAILKGHVDFQSDPWPRISSQAKDCVRMLLTSVRIFCNSPPHWTSKPETTGTDQHYHASMCVHRQPAQCASAALPAQQCLCIFVVEAKNS